ncbi:hypothetical protein ABENE_08355 [Asticcacaulis benevestitus DSM 16100 = ATCC BAA-896]|uniref:DUF429 domain-containing protein n=1 Tax=Asticcacaulis benevestitus DSM 16100 = ATCC BAA-896 TaxID=1121022 RepID=V4RM72_9CAUL|nr:hypothetical protein ABENE_08355 [Asticcacaulis benevestitus DSM 16100 = ATCC BAA-896]
MIEVYPHPALVELADAPRRLEYKAGNMGKYWKDLSAEKRRYKLFKTWQTIENLLEPEISGVSMSLPKITLSSKVAQLKAYEDTLDAIICAWVGICALEGRAIPFGDSESAIWIPRKAPIP